MSKDLFPTVAPPPPHWTAWIKLPGQRWKALGREPTEAQAWSRLLNLHLGNCDKTAILGDARP